MTLSNRKCQFLYKKKVGRTLLYEVSPYTVETFLLKCLLLYEFSIAYGSSGSGSIYEPFTVISKCKWGGSFASILADVPTVPIT